MTQLQVISLWFAGALALLSMLGIVSLMLKLIFIQIDVVQLAIAGICLANAYLGARERRG